MIRPISETRSETRKHYLKLRRAFLKENPVCAVYSTERATEIHHTRGRAGTLYLDTRFWRAVSRKGHEWIERNRTKAREAGLLCPEGLFNTPPKDVVTASLRIGIALARKGES